MAEFIDPSQGVSPQPGHPSSNHKAVAVVEILVVVLVLAIAFTWWQSSSRKTLSSVDLNKSAAAPVVSETPSPTPVAGLGTEISSGFPTDTPQPNPFPDVYTNPF